MQVKPYEGSIDLGKMKESPVFLDAQVNKISFALPQTKRKLTLDYGKEFKDVVFIHAGEALHTYFSITCDNE